MEVSNAEILHYFSSIEPFKSLGEKDLNDIVFKTSQKSFKKDETIFREGEPADTVWVLYKGRVKVFKYTSEGLPFAIESLAPGELFGTLCRLGGNGRTYPCTAVAAEPTQAISILDHTFLNYYMKSPGMVRGVCALCSDRLKDVQDLRCMGQESVSIRVANILLRLHRIHGGTLPFTKKEISELVGTTLRTTFRTLSEFKKKGLLTSQGGKIQIIKSEELKKIIYKN